MSVNGCECCPLLVHAYPVIGTLSDHLSKMATLPNSTNAGIQAGCVSFRERGINGVQLFNRLVTFKSVYIV